MDSINVWNMRENTSQFSQTLNPAGDCVKKYAHVASKGKLLKLANVPTQSVLMRNSILEKP